MAIRLVFLVGNGKIFVIQIRNREIYYADKISGVQMLYPTPSKAVLRTSGEPTEEDIKEYNMCKTEEELMAFVIRDVKKMGGRLIKKDIIKDE